MHTAVIGPGGYKHEIIHLHSRLNTEIVLSRNKCTPLESGELKDHIEQVLF